MMRAHLHFQSTGSRGLCECFRIGFRYIRERERGYSALPTRCRANTQNSWASAQFDTSARERGDLLARETNGAQPPTGVEEYVALKKQLFKRARRAGGFLAVYLFLSQGLLATICSGVGSAAGYVYLQLLAREVDQYTAESEVPLLHAQQVSVQPMRAIFLGGAAYSQALRPRLLVPIGLGALVGLFNLFSQEPLNNLLMFDMLLGFLCYKAGLFLALYDDVKPKFDPTLLNRAVRPSLADLPDPDEEAREDAIRARKRH